MTLPAPNLKPAFNLTRASHLVLRSRDLAAAKTFYTQIIGLVISDEEPDALYLRGIEETAHHSLVLYRDGKDPACDRVGFRAFTNDDVSAAYEHFKARGLPAKWVERPYQGPTIHVSDPNGMRFEICATMERRGRLLLDLQAIKGAGALRMDHFQVLVPDVDAAYPFYAEMGFRISDYVQDQETGDTTMAFMYRKNSPWDLVLVRRRGPRFHHCGYVVPDITNIFKACDLMPKYGWGHEVERGPGRHGLGHSLFVYLRDPDGHRIELLPPAIQLVDVDEEPVRWSAKDGFIALDWGLKAPRRWFEEAAAFIDVPQKEPSYVTEPLTLERQLGIR